MRGQYTQPVKMLGEIIFLAITFMLTYLVKPYTFLEVISIKYCVGFSLYTYNMRKRNICYQNPIFVKKPFFGPYFVDTFFAHSRDHATELTEYNKTITLAIRNVLYNTYLLGVT